MWGLVRELPSGLQIDAGRPALPSFIVQPDLAPTSLHTDRGAFRCARGPSEETRADEMPEPPGPIVVYWQQP